jgi:ABC-type Co2+ transport system permease subunit
MVHALTGRQPSPRRAAWAGIVTGWITVVFTAGLNAAVLILGGDYDWTIIAKPLFAVYLILGVIEGLILGTTAGFLVRVRPDLLRLPPVEAARVDH